MRLYIKLALKKLLYLKLSFSEDMLLDKAIEFNFNNAKLLSTLLTGFQELDQDVLQDVNQTHKIAVINTVRKPKIFFWRGGGFTYEITYCQNMPVEIVFSFPVFIFFGCFFCLCVSLILKAYLYLS